MGKYPIPKGDVKALYAKFQNEGQQLSIMISDEEQQKMNKLSVKIVRNIIKKLLVGYVAREDLNAIIEQWILIAYCEESHFYHGNQRFHIIKTMAGYHVSEESLLERQITDFLNNLEMTKEKKDELKDQIILECKKCSRQQNSLLSDLSSGWNSSK